MRRAHELALTILEKPAWESVPIAGQLQLGAAPSLSPQQLPEPISLWGSRRDCPQQVPAAMARGCSEPTNIWSWGPHSVLLGESLQLAQAGHSLRSIWAASLVGSEPLEDKLPWCTHWEHISPSIWALSFMGQANYFGWGIMLERGIVYWTLPDLGTGSFARAGLGGGFRLGSGRGILDYTSSDFFVCVTIG